MSTQTTRTITLTKDAEGRWTAYDATTRTVTEGNTRGEALDKLDDETREEEEVEQWNPVNPDDPIFNPTTFSSGDTDTSERIDEVLYGAGDTDE
jgi:hypothetical protein